MAKKSRKTIKNKKNNNKILFDNERFLGDLEPKIRNIVNSSLLQIDQRINQLHEMILNVKANLITVNTLLERKGLLEKEEFYNEFLIQEKMEVGGVDSLGRMDGKPIFSIYNNEDSKGV